MAYPLAGRVWSAEAKHLEMVALRVAIRLLFHGWGYPPPAYALDALRQGVDNG
jgi:hypothetical protein